MPDERDKQYRKAIEALNAANGIHPEDNEFLQEFTTQLRRASEKGTTWQGHLLHTALVIARHREPPTTNNNRIHGLGLRELMESPDAIEEFRDWIDERRTAQTGRSQPLSDRTKELYYGTVRAMGELMTPGDDRPDHVEALPVSIADNSDPTPHPSTILYWDDHVTQILDAPDVNRRDKALVAVSWESGARPWEVADLVWNDFEFRDDYAVLTIEDGKTVDRDIRLVASMPYLKRWANRHPIHDALEDGAEVPDDTPLWSLLDAPRKLRTVSQRTKIVGERVGLSRPTNHRQFRKSRASILAMSPEVAEQSLRFRFGWTPKSDAPAHYKARFGTEAEDQIAQADGVQIELADEHQDPAPVRCPNCEEWTPRHRESCLFCEKEIDVEAAEQNQAAILVQDEELAAKMRELMELVGNGEIDPEAIRRAQPFADVLTEEPDMADKADMFLDALDDDEL